MSQFVYNFSIHLLAGIYTIVSLLNAKAKLFVSGRKNLFTRLAASFRSVPSPVIWVHCASLGEFEQGRPIIEALRTQFPKHKILLTFFSPSGYENKKDYTQADFIFYLPWDTPTNAKRFIEITKPVLAIFIKYEFWYNYSQALKNRSIPLISASCILRPEQAFFKWYGSVFRKTLYNFHYFFTQNIETQELLTKLHIPSTVAGDTRFDRVHQITQSGAAIELAARFKNNQKVLVAGSCWKEDMEVLSPFINDHYQQLKFIIAPHEISESFLNYIEKSISAKTIRYSQAKEGVEDYDVLIIDNIGMLSRLYRYGEFAYVGGAFGDGLHNILEAACYGLPIFFGNKNYKKFQEATDLMMRGGAFEVSGYTELKQKYESLNNRPENFLLACEVTRAYVQENLGATKKIVDYCTKLIPVS
ncbi:MAG: 3-deoxy-D-manno-octulosonic acid transferase [Cyclobacteriaceae bacterium]|jgi:3-deoxy-D-manno-octulosonic-acid transferase|nr:3-deoxy-D-manno-octulosonic acid transferase [Flammeovirgaceae bacterium]